MLPECICSKILTTIVGLLQRTGIKLKPCVHYSIRKPGYRPGLRPKSRELVADLVCYCDQDSIMESPTHPLKKYCQRSRLVLEHRGAQLSDLTTENTRNKNLFVCYVELENFLQCLEKGDNATSKSIKRKFPVYWINSMKEC